MSEARYVLDASALLSAMLDEPGADAVAQLLPDACIGVVNVSEVVAKLVERGVRYDDIVESLADLDLDIRDFDLVQALRAGELRAATREAGLSLGDRACLALAASIGAEAITTDRAWAMLNMGVSIRLAR